ncbi:MAG: ABC transporter ATP-binding protein [Saprospiraceae bacterium]|nr:ABC transporter ATP-binding protein [Saprospiraceae bacterium]
MTNPILSVENVETFYDRIRVLHGISFTIQPGTITTILGNNGAGKTTILKTIMGLIDDEPDKGKIYFRGRPIHRRETVRIVRRGIGYVPEGREVFPELSVRENLLTGAYQQRGRRQIKKDIDNMYRYFPVLRERRKQLAGTLSGGEQQMLAIARALMNRPVLLLLDEPSLGLSPILVHEIFEIIAEIRKTGTTILLIEQNAHKALEISDYGYVLENGRFVTAGNTAQLRADEDVREFYLGIKAEESIKGYQRYKRKRRWR